MAAVALALARTGRLWLPAAASVARYHARPLRRLQGGLYLPDPRDERTPEWQRRPRWQAKLYGRHGAASGLDPAQLWPDPARLRELREEEAAWEPPLAHMQARIRAREEEERRQRLDREKLIAANMARMPQMVEDWRREKREKREKRRAEAARRKRLLAQAQERFGYNLDQRSLKFQEMVKEMEKEEKKKEKLAKKKLKAEAVAMAAAAPPAQAAA
ncbi:growth arrest and DNA damage-inducible proteins-interacting protein 1-like [Rhinatrema bivittatum]|uniref:growth arrest and DNA damage-inducible proteins-interacting protein 1-like n=1 Tax=Rhinatrema bivittatum TaxID=194408 RepID=UPI00112A0783|nr:growth arrest and DNA damage-inducible proteins-interacting protein 1-like [Rhinatrema bivittatum]XP_029441273.1 growth arrest and DNA damage-inducible proteins-interacting protein 1-like [Rhinatrema bivittatum]